MATVRDPTDPKGTRRPDNGPITMSAHRFKPITIAERSLKIYLPLTIRPNNACGIFSLVFTNGILNMLVKNKNKYKALHHQYFKAP